MLRLRPGLASRKAAFGPTGGFPEGAKTLFTSESRLSDGPSPATQTRFYTTPGRLGISPSLLMQNYLSAPAALVTLPLFPTPPS